MVLACVCRRFAVDAADNWKRYARRHVAGPNELGPRVKVHAGLELRMYGCPSCARLLDIEVALADDPPLFDVELDAPSVLARRERYTELMLK